MKEPIISTSTAMPFFKAYSIHLLILMFILGPLIENISAQIDVYGVNITTGTSALAGAGHYSNTNASGGPNTGICLEGTSDKDGPVAFNNSGTGAFNSTIMAAAGLDGVAGDDRFITPYASGTVRHVEQEVMFSTGNASFVGLTDPYLIVHTGMKGNASFTNTATITDCNGNPYPLTVLAQLASDPPNEVYDPDSLAVGVLACTTCGTGSQSQPGYTVIQITGNVTCINAEVYCDHPTGTSTNRQRMLWALVDDLEEMPSCGDAGLTAMEICDYSLEFPKSELALDDCDNGTIDNATECAVGGNPLDNPADDLDPPVQCPSGQENYTVLHISDTEAYIPGGNCVTTTISGMVTGSLSPSNADALNSVFVNTSNNIEGGGSLVYKTNDGDFGEVSYEFCSPLTDPFIYIGESGPETNTVIGAYEADGVTPIPVTYIDGQPGFETDGNNGFTASIYNKKGYGQIQDGVARSEIVIKFTNAAPGGGDMFRLGFGVCASDLSLVGQPVCPLGLFSLLNRFAGGCPRQTPAGQRR